MSHSTTTDNYKLTVRLLLDGPTNYLLTEQKQTFLVVWSLNLSMILVYCLWNIQASKNEIKRHSYRRELPHFFCLL